MTIYALSSGPGISGIAVIRVSGKNTSEVIKKLTGSKLPPPRVATLKKFNKNGQKNLIDEGVIIWFPAPNSYTGEDLAEFHVHGSRAVINAMHSAISKIKNCRLAEPGEFTKRAFQNGRINLLKAESIADLISSETEIQRKQALKIMSGKSSDKFNSWREKLLKILSHVEAKIDFPEEDLPQNIMKKIQKTSNDVLKEIKKTLNDQKVGERIREGFKIAILGPPNSGKSSLLNYLSKRDVAIVSEIAGTTRDVIETHLNLDGYPVIVSDTAGIRNSKNEIEKKGIKIAFKRAEDADLKLVIISSTNVDFTSVLKKLLTKNAILVANKDCAQELREIVDKLENTGSELHSLHTKVFRPWGWFQTIDEGEQFKVKIIHLNPHSKISLQRHKYRAEHWIVILGTAKVTCGRKNFSLSQNESTFIPSAEKHRLENNTDTALRLIEIQTGERLEEADIERFDDDYGRD